MNVSHHDRETQAKLSLDNASRHRENANRPFELNCLDSAATCFLSVAVARFPTSDAGIDYLLSRDVAAIIRRIAELAENDFQTLTRTPGKPAVALRTRVTPVHIGWLVHEWDASNCLLSIATSSLVATFFPSTPFWSEYNRALNCLVRHESYNPNPLKPKGYEKYWTPYLALIADATNHLINHETRDDLSASFAKRNRDKRYIDWDMVDGDGKYPVQWDFRERSIMAFCANSKLDTR